MTDLDKLIEAVEAGVATEDHFAGVWSPSDLLAWRVNQVAMEAYNGSLDAALRLHEALLPGWEFWLKQSHDKFSCAVALDGIWHAMILAEASTPARAWLLAVLLALKAKGEA